MKKDISASKKSLLTLWFIAGIWITGYIALTLRHTQAVKITAAIVVSLAYWTGYGRWHHMVFKNTKFDKPVESLKGFSFFLLFLAIFLIVFTECFLFKR